jgi:hypothetical protein
MNKLLKQRPQTADISSIINNRNGRKNITEYCKQIEQEYKQKVTHLTVKDLRNLKKYSNNNNNNNNNNESVLLSSRNTNRSKLSNNSDQQSLKAMMESKKPIVIINNNMNEDDYERSINYKNRKITTTIQRIHSARSDFCSSRQCIDN